MGPRLSGHLRSTTVPRRQSNPQLRSCLRRNWCCRAVHGVHGFKGLGPSAPPPQCFPRPAQGCASDGEGLHPGLGALLKSLIWGLAVEAAVGPVVVVEVLPLLELVVEHLGVVDDHAVQQPVELLGVNAMRALHLAIQPRGAGLDVDMAGASVQDMLPSARSGLSSPA